jgi:SagB-type dehydrogenase family enzyme
MNDLGTVFDYHQRTKHSLQRYAAGPEFLDWDSQLDPFRTFTGSPQVELPLLEETTEPRYTALYQPGSIAPQPLALASIAALFELAFGLSAWKEYGGNTWALRCNPSSGNLHPTESYLVVQGCDGIADGVHHYVSRDHVLEQRCRINEDQRLLSGSFLVGLSSVHLRESWKYGERAFRYCQHDAGHAIAAVRYAAATLGWQVRLLEEWGDAEVATLLGLDREADFGAAEREHPDLLLQVSVGQAGSFDSSGLLQVAGSSVWQGHANTLSREKPIFWPVIEQVAAACSKPRTEVMLWTPPGLPPPLVSDCTSGAAALIKQRRSGQRFDGVTTMSREHFYRMLDMMLPRPGVAPWDAIGWSPRIHLFLFVHRVEGLSPGLYLFLRDPAAEVALRTALARGFEWFPVEGSPVHFSMFRLLAGDVQKAARTLSCHQQIASHGAFSLGMLATFEENLTAAPWRYRQLFWEAGMLGQVLYLEAEAVSVRGTGIGCYFDDEVHDLLGIDGRRFQSLYHFTVGGAVVDERLQTLPAYGHLSRTE